jgi:hypothetical protein
MLKAEIKRWKARWTTAKPMNPKDTLNITNEALYPSISTVLLILYTMRASTATTERSFSALRRFKTYLERGHPRTIPPKFGSNWPSGFRGVDLNEKLMDGCSVVTIAHL